MGCCTGKMHISVMTEAILFHINSVVIEFGSTIKLWFTRAVNTVGMM
jgi:hypothetical protein